MTIPPTHIKSGAETANPCRIYKNLKIDSLSDFDPKSSKSPKNQSFIDAILQDPKLEGNNPYGNEPYLIANFLGWVRNFNFNVLGVKFKFLDFL